MKSTIKSMLKSGVERAVRPHGYRLIKPSNVYGVDPISDVSRLSRLWNIDIATVFDVGANLGASSLAFAEAWPESEVIAFEPSESVAEALRANVAAQGRIRAHQLAVGARTGQSEFYVNADHSVLSSLNSSTPYAERFGHKSAAVAVSVTTLDDFCREQSIDRINLLKIDTEGSDHDVLRGAERLIAERQIDFIYCEFYSMSPCPDEIGSLIPIASLLGEASYNFVASYNDYILTDGRFFSVSNALFAAGPRSS